MRMNVNELALKLNSLVLSGRGDCEINLMVHDCNCWKIQRLGNVEVPESVDWIILKGEVKE